MLSISIVIYQLDCDLFRRLLDSLSIALDKVSEGSSGISIKIIDNGNQQTIIENLSKDYLNKLPTLEIISGIKNIGYGRAHNLGILSSTSKYHLVLNPDVILNSDCLIEGIKHLESNKDICAVAPACKDEKGQVQYLAKRYPSVLDLALRGVAPRFIKKYFQKRLSRYEMHEVLDKESAVHVDIISGCFMLCRTEYLKKIGGFDERYFLYFEDFALSMEMKKLGALQYLSSMKIIHYGGNTAEKGFKHIFLFIVSGIKFFNCYGWKIR